MGEDGAVQGLLELAGVPYVGAGVLGSAVGMDKAVQKVLFAAAGPARRCRGTVVREPEWDEDPEGVAARVAGARVPVFVEAGDARVLGRHLEGARPRRAGGRRSPRRSGTRARPSWSGASTAIREIECAVLGNDDPVASVSGEIVPTGHEFYDYEAKYLDDDGAQLRDPGADLPADARRSGSSAMAVTAFHAIECWGMARVDFFLRGDDELWINEINTIPGFTSISMYPKLWEASGLSLPRPDRAAARPGGRAPRRRARQEHDRARARTRRERGSLGPSAAGGPTGAPPGR